VIAVMDDFDTKQWTVTPGKTFDLSQCRNQGDPTMPPAPCYENWAQSTGRKSIDFQHMLLNAPKVYSRYYGTFHGVVIADDALFAVSHFRFQSDPVMNQAPLLPLVKDRIFHMSDQ
jgi:hypothetical protein